jgi:hypothetical protein
MANQNLTGISKNLAASIKADQAHKEVEKFPLAKIRIGISVSDSENALTFGFSKLHQKDFTIELTRYLLANGAHLVYGGDLRKEGFTLAFSELAFQYRRMEADGNALFTNFFGWPIHIGISKSEEVEFKKNRVEIIKIAAPIEVPRKLRNTFVPPDAEENKIYWAKSMTLMREQMVSNCHARIFLGGQVSGYKGFYPGIIEEAYLTLERRQSAYFLGAIGGATSYIIRAIKGEKPRSLANELSDLYPAASKLLPSKSLDSLLTKIGAVGLKGLASINGLTVHQNKVLFESRHFQEMIFFILKGLHSRKKR